MRNLAIVGLKLLGILGIYWAASEISLIVQYFSLYTFDDARYPHFAEVWMQLIGWLLTCLVSAAFAFALLARTDWIVAKLKFPEDPPSPGMEPAQLLRVGFVVLGAYAVIEALPAIGSTVYSISALNLRMSHASGPADIGHVISPALKFILGCIVIGQSERFARSVFSGR